MTNQIPIKCNLHTQVPLKCDELTPAVVLQRQTHSSASLTAVDKSRAGHV